MRLVRKRYSTVPRTVLLVVLHPVALKKKNPSPPDPTMQGGVHPILHDKEARCRRPYYILHMHPYELLQRPISDAPPSRLRHVAVGALTYNTPALDTVSTRKPRWRR